MARIRSTHPDQWCDEDFVELSFAARLLAIGVRNFCDDKGVFEWKPKTLKMKVFPADNVDCSDLLAELMDHGQVIKFEIDGKSYGAVRNFQKFQKPKKPNDIYPISEEARLYVGSVSEPVENQLPTGGEIPFQMEDGEGIGGEERKKSSVPFSAFWSVWPNKNAKQRAEAAWKKLSETDRLAAIASLPQWFDTWRSRNPQASPLHPATFLNGRRWEDEQPQFEAINGGQHGQRTSQGTERLRAFVGGSD